MPRYSHLERKFEKTFLGDLPFWEGGDLVCGEQDDDPIFPKYPFCKVSVLLVTLFFKSSYRAKSLVRNGIESIRP